MRTWLENDIRFNIRLNLFFCSLAGLFDRNLLGIYDILDFVILAALQLLLYFTAIFIFLLIYLRIMQKQRMNFFLGFRWESSLLWPKLVYIRLSTP